MKNKKRFAFLLSTACAAVVALSLVACNGNSGSDDPSDSTDPQAALPAFTTASKAEIDSKSFELSLSMETNNTLSLSATCTGKVSSGGGSKGGKGGQQESTSEEEDTTDYSVYNFSVSGSWTEESGYGYVFTLGTELYHVNYDIYSGCHYFYYTAKTTIEGEVKTADSAVKFTAQDTAYMKKLSSDYKIYELRACTYHFYGGADASGGNLNVTDIYLMADGTAIDMTGRDSITYKSGTWTSEAGVITVNIGTSQYVSETSKDGKGYRLNYVTTSSKGGSSGYYVYTAKADGTYYMESDFEVSENPAP